MRATHIDYKHPFHLRVEGCKGHRFHDGPCAVEVLCVAPSSSLYPKLNRPGLPSLRKEPESNWDLVYKTMLGRST